MSVSAVDIVIPCLRANVGLLYGCLKKLEESIDVPHSVIVIADGFVQEDAAPVKRILESQLVKSRELVRHEIAVFPQPLYLQRCVQHALSLISEDASIVAFVPPHLHLTDPAWFGKVQQPLSQDGLAAVAFFGCRNYDFSIDPARVTEHIPDLLGAAVSRRFLGIHPLAGEWKNLNKRLAVAAESMGCTCWAVQSVACEVFVASRHEGPSPTLHAGKKVGTASGTDPRSYR